MIGKDTKRSGYTFEYSLVAELTASGADVYLLHITTMPSVPYVVRTEEFNYDIMISANHNPYCDNGIKVISEKGEKLEESVIEEIERYLNGGMGEVPLTKKDQIGRTVDFATGRGHYVGYLISIATRSLKNMRVGLDCANESASVVTKSVFDALGAETHVINNSPDGLNVDIDCGSAHIHVLRRFMKGNHPDVGSVYDDDADRCIAVDCNGNVVDGDAILYICRRYTKEQGTLFSRTVVTTIMSNLRLYKAFDGGGISYEKATVGGKYVYENMTTNSNCLGEEQPGHAIFNKYAITGDGILTPLKVMEVTLEKKQPLDKLASELEIFPQALKNVRVKDKVAVQDDEDVEAEVSEVSETLGGNGRILLHQPDTESVVRVMVEASDHETCEKYVDQVTGVMKAKGHLL